MKKIRSLRIPGDIQKYTRIMNVLSEGGGGQQGPDLQYPVCGAGRGKEEGEGQAEGNK